MAEQLALLPEYLTAHIQLTLVSLLLSTAISLPLGIIISRTPWCEQTALGVASIIQTIPSLALLAIMVPLLAGFELPSIGFLPAIIGLTLYGVLPILRNTVTGITGVDAAIKESAQGVGMTTWQQLFLIELPLARPVIMAGLRTSTVWIVGVATLSTPVGATSLGNYIFSGLQTQNYTAVMVGCVAAASLALVLDSLVLAMETGIRNGRKGIVAMAGAFSAILALFTVITLGTPHFIDRERPVVIGAKTFTEQYILSAIMAEWVEQKTGRSTILVQSLGSMVAFDALASGDIDLYVEYSGTLWANEMNRGHEITSRSQVIKSVEQFLNKQHGITLVARLGFENAYALAVRQEDAQRLGLNQIGDIRLYAPSWVLGGDYEFFARPEWELIRQAYALDFSDIRTMDSALMYQAAAQNEVDIISAFSSDGRIRSYGLVALNDELGVIPPYDAVVLASRRLSKEEPSVTAAIAALDSRINVDLMRELNLAVDEEGELPASVANRFVRALSSDKSVR